MRAREGFNTDVADDAGVQLGAGAAPFVLVREPDGGTSGDPEAYALLDDGGRPRRGPVLNGDVPRATLLLAAPPDGQVLRVTAFGVTRLPGPQAQTRWLGQRTGQLLKLLVARRYGIVTGAALATEVWGYEGFASSGAVRRCICDLRGRLAGLGADAIVARQGGYGLDADVVAVDADDFRAHLGRALRALEHSRLDLAHAHLRLAADLYRGEFLADEPDAAWALRERELLREDIEAVHSRLATLCWARGDERGATDSLRRLSELAPYDAAVHRRLSGFLLGQGRTSAAERCFATFAQRLERDLGRRPDFTLSDLAPGDLSEEAPRL